MIDDFVQLSRSNHVCLFLQPLCLFQSQWPFHCFDPWNCAEIRFLQGRNISTRKLKKAVQLLSWWNLHCLKMTFDGNLPWYSKYVLCFRIEKKLFTKVRTMSSLVSSKCTRQHRQQCILCLQLGPLVPWDLCSVDKICVASAIF